MKSLDAKGRELEEVVDILLLVDPNNADKKIADRDMPLIGRDDTFIAKVKVQRLKGELKKYVTRSSIFEEQIAYINKKIREIEDKFPEIKLDIPKI